MDSKINQLPDLFRGKYARSLRLFVLLMALMATALFVTPLRPVLPVAGLDSWVYALNEGVARRLVFGRDLIFTFGPLASIYTRMYHPATDWMMLIGSALIGAGLSVGCALLVYPRRPLQVLILPFLVALAWPDGPFVSDSVFVFLPFVLFLLVFRACAPAGNENYLRPSPVIWTAIGTVAASVALLPLVKGSFAAPALLSVGLSFIFLLRRYPSGGAIFACLVIAAVSCAWVAAGQPIAALPGFFVAQVAIISGYSEAMSLDGPTPEVAIYIIVSVVLVGIFYWRFARQFGKLGLVAVVSLAFTLFVCFKAGFVRHDAHALIAAGALLLAGYCVSAITRWGPSLAVWVLVLFAWAYIDHAYTGLDIGKASQRFYDALNNTCAGIKLRISNPQQLQTLFDQSNGAIRAQLRLPPVNGTVDMYQYELSPIFAYGLPWAPRPVIQSYSAYSPRLDALNVAHLESKNAPQHVFFQIQTIDNQLPALEDAGSWPILLARYRVSGRAGQLLVLDRNALDTNGPEMENVSTGIWSIGRWFDLPKAGEPIWAEIELEPTLLGRIFAALFKPPQLHILFRYENGHTESFRYLAAMGRSGFIISPVIHDSSDFAALLMQGCEEYFSPAAPISVEITGETGSPLLWKTAFAVRFRRIELPIQLGAEQFVFDQSISDPTVNGKVAGSAECSIDTVDWKPINTQVIDVKGPLLVQGWAAVSPETGIAGDEVLVTIASNEGKFLRGVRARTGLRPDVNTYFKHPEMGAVGFEASLDSRDVKGTYKIQIYVRQGNQIFSCPTTVQIRF